MKNILPKYEWDLIVGQLKFLQEQTRLIGSLKKIPYTEVNDKLGLVLTPYEIQGIISTEFETYMQIGELSIKMGKKGPALRYFTQAVVINPNNVIAKIYKALLTFELKKYMQSILAYDEVILLDSSIASSYANKGAAFCYLEIYHAALNMFNQAIKLAPSNHIIYRNKSFALAKLGRNEEASECTELAKKISAITPLSVLNMWGPFKIKEVKADNLTPDKLKLCLAKPVIHELPEIDILQHNNDEHNKSKRQKLDELPMPQSAVAQDELRCHELAKNANHEKLEQDCELPKSLSSEILVQDDDRFLSSVDLAQLPQLESHNDVSVDENPEKYYPLSFESYNVPDSLVGGEWGFVDKEEENLDENNLWVDGCFN